MWMNVRGECQCGGRMDGMGESVEANDIAASTTDFHLPPSNQPTFLRPSFTHTFAPDTLLLLPLVPPSALRRRDSA